MPPGIDGIEAARQIRALDPNIFLAIVTAYSDRLPEEVGTVLGGNFTMIRKPFHSDKIVELVDHYLQTWNRKRSAPPTGEEKYSKKPWTKVRCCEKVAITATQQFSQACT
jgi:DNA-binding NtrC family response regulator